jgi:cysteine-S-conjugate beta-lyase
MPKAIQTTLIHSDYQAPAGFVGCQPAIHHASTILFKDVAQMRAQDWHSKSGYTYGLHGTPTTFELEARIAEIEGGQHCVLAPSGLAAISLVFLACLKTGDDVLLPDNAYNPGRGMMDWLGRDFGITVRYYQPTVGAAIADLILPNTRLIWAETPGSVSFEIPDIAAMAKVARQHRVLLGVDNTWSAGLAYRPLEHGADIVMQALTKYQSGGSDVLMGALITREESTYRRLNLAHMRLGYGVSGDDAYLVLRSLPTLKLRFDAHDKAARQIATWLLGRPEVATVLHPAFPDCPGHEIWQRDFSAAGGIFSVLLDPAYSSRQVDALVDHLQLFKIGFSWGGAHSLCIPCQMNEIRREWHHQGQLLRFNIGLEDVQDLINDIEQAFQYLA